MRSALGLFIAANQIAASAALLGAALPALAYARAVEFARIQASQASSRIESRRARPPARECAEGAGRVLARPGPAQ